MSKMSVPPEIIEMIREYAFYDVEKRTKETKNKICSLINNTEWKSNDPVIMSNLIEGEWLFYIDADKTSRQLQCMFCVRCGDYIISHTDENQMYCRCPDDIDIVEEDIENLEINDM